ncbi:restriction endonuclease subunit S [Mariniplasma anaerobium]|uniref:Type I restriction modification DNA specificity domain-containing protein n=1 Tax=Mariniplasma anaerobium TaxID=2735436 RepID=A0A7U9TH80_9MOLU|nr:restriction endonuclease subunit S [Mariniplasma anaerobium]BCR35175.1 hypothetical protein MPAN_000680 [Mariniplasma anaerobium]
MERLIKLSKVCDISAGLVLRRKEAQTKSEIIKTYKLITLKSLEDDGWVNSEYLDDYNSFELLDDRYLTKENDILIRLSSPYTAIKVKAEQVGFVIPSLFAIIRLNKKDIDSGYLSFVLNSDTIKKSYFKNAMGITIPVVRMQTIRETQIPMVSTTKQQIISKINDLMIREKRLHQQLTLEKEVYNKELTKRIIKGGNKNAK